MKLISLFILLFLLPMLGWKSFGDSKFVRLTISSPKGEAPFIREKNGDIITKHSTVGWTFISVEYTPEEREGKRKDVFTITLKDEKTYKVKCSFSNLWIWILNSLAWSDKIWYCEISVYEKDWRWRASIKNDWEQTKWFVDMSDLNAMKKKVTVNWQQVTDSYDLVQYCINTLIPTINDNQEKF